MDAHTLDNYLHLHKLAKGDQEYNTLCRLYQESDQRLLALLSRLSDEDAQILMDYVGLFGAAQMRLQEIACENMVFPGKM